MGVVIGAPGLFGRMGAGDDPGAPRCVLVAGEIWFPGGPGTRRAVGARRVALAPLSDPRGVGGLSLCLPSDPVGDRLSGQQLRVAQLLAAGATVPEVAVILSRSEGTVRTHVRRVYDALGVRTRIQLASALSGRGEPADDLDRAFVVTDEAGAPRWASAGALGWLAAGGTARLAAAGAGGRPPRLDAPFLTAVAWRLQGTQPGWLWVIGGLRRATAASALTDRQQEVCALLLAGRTRGAIARRLGIGEETVKTHVQRIYDAFDVRSLVALARRLDGGDAVDAGLPVAVNG